MRTPATLLGSLPPRLGSAEEWKPPYSEITRYVVERLTAVPGREMRALIDRTADVRDRIAAAYHRPLPPRQPRPEPNGWRRHRGVGPHDAGGVTM